MYINLIIKLICVGTPFWKCDWYRCDILQHHWNIILTSYFNIIITNAYLFDNLIDIHLTCSSHWDISKWKKQSVRVSRLTMTKCLNESSCNNWLIKANFIITHLKCTISVSHCLIYFSLTVMSSLHTTQCCVIRCICILQYFYNITHSAANLQLK